MLRDRLLGWRWLSAAVVAWGVGWAALPNLAEAAPLPPVSVAGSPADLETSRVGLERTIVRDRLAALGVSPAEAEAVLDRLSPEERAEMAARASELEAGGNPAAAVIAVAIIVSLVVVLVLELLGRRVVSRP